MFGALFKFETLLEVIILLICTATYVHSLWPSLLDSSRHGAAGIFWQFARIGERLSPYVSLICVIMAARTLLGY